MISTLNDIVKWLNELFSGKIITNESLETMTKIISEKNTKMIKIQGYESFYAYNPCNGIYLALAYNVKPKQQLIFIQIADQIFKKLHKSKMMLKAVMNYQKNNLLPTYCCYQKISFSFFEDRSDIHEIG